MRFKKTTLENGVRVITVPMTGNPTVTVMIAVGTGSFFEKPEQSGISHFLEHVCFKGTAKRPSAKAITTELDSIGALYNAFTMREATGFYAKADVKHFAKISDIIADIFKNPTLPEKEVEREKGVITGEIDMYADDPQEKVAEALMKHMYDGEPAARDVLGTKDTVQSISRDDLVAYKAMQYTGPNTIVTIAGGIKEDDMLAYARAYFSDLDNSLPSPEFMSRDREQNGPETVFVTKDTDQAHVVMAWRTFDRSHPDRYVANIIKHILKGGMSSRLFLRLREEMGSGYYINASNSMHKSFGAFLISTGTKHERVPEIVSAIIEEVRKLSTDGVSSEELEKVKEYLRAHRLMSLETSDDVAEYCAEQELLEGEIKTPAEFEAIYAKIGPEDILRVAQIVFDMKKFTLAVIGKGIDKKALQEAVNS